MDILYDWAENIAVMVILVSVAANLLPKNHYEKYVRLFTGLIMIVLLVKPLGSFSTIPEKLDDIFTFDSIKQELEEGKTGLDEFSTKLEEKQLESYEKSLETRLSLILEAEGRSLKDFDYEICLEPEKEEYGQIEMLRIYLEENKNNSSGSAFLKNFEEEEETRIKEKICEYYQLEKEQVMLYG